MGNSWNSMRKTWIPWGIYGIPMKSVNSIVRMYVIVIKCDTRRRTKRLPSLRFSTPIRCDTIRYQCDRNIWNAMEYPWKSHGEP